MKPIILTKKSDESGRLHERLIHLNADFNQISCYTPDTLPESLDCEIIFSTWSMPQFTKEEIKQVFPKLRAIFYAAGTVKQFATPFLESGIRIFSAASANGIPVAEYATAQILLANKGYFQAQRKYQWPIWRRGFRNIREISEKHTGNYGASVGILGCGSIGSMVVTFLKPHSLNIKIYDPYISDIKAKELGVCKASLNEIFSTCDVISNHMPDTIETKGIIDKKILQSMRPYATFINTGRGAQIREKDLNAVLKKRKDICAVLDVTSHEPLFPWSGLYWRKNVFLTPHIAGSLSDEVNRMIDFSYQAYINYINDHQPAGEVVLKDLEYHA